jgi:hypothetical protein
MPTTTGKPLNETTPNVSSDTDSNRKSGFGPGTCWLKIQIHAPLRIRSHEPAS